MGSAYVKVHPKRASQRPPAELRSFAPMRLPGARPLTKSRFWKTAFSTWCGPGRACRWACSSICARCEAWVRDNAPGRSVLNLFAYTCAFGVSAMLGKAERVVNVDVSRPYLEWGQDNYRLNDLAADPRDFIYGDAFDWLGRFARRGTRFDLVVVDPPSFSSTPFSVSRDYPRLVDAAARVVAHAGILVAATNHAGTSDERFEAWLRAGLETAGRHGQIVERWHEPANGLPGGAWPQALPQGASTRSRLTSCLNSDH